MVVRTNRPTNERRSGRRRENAVNRQPVASSNLRDVGYDAASRTLEVGFKDGGVYQYYGVPPHIYRGLMSAGSKGGYLADHVKGIYRYRRVG